MTFAWTARLARVGVYSVESTPRLIDQDTILVSPGPVPLTDRNGEVIGTVRHVQKTERWVYAFGVVTDPGTAALMRSGQLTPEFALHDARMTPPDRDFSRIITHGRIAAVRAAINPSRTPGAQALWSGLRFTVEDPT